MREGAGPAPGSDSSLTGDLRECRGASGLLWRMDSTRAMRIGLISCLPPARLPGEQLLTSARLVLLDLSEKAESASNLEGSWTLARGGVLTGRRTLWTSGRPG